MLGSRAAAGAPAVAQQRHRQQRNQAAGTFEARRGGFGHLGVEHHVRARGVAELLHVGQEGHRLHRLAKALSARGAFEDVSLAVPRYVHPRGCVQMHVDGLAMRNSSMRAIRATNFTGLPTPTYQGTSKRASERASVRARVRTRCVCVRARAVGCCTISSARIPLMPLLCKLTIQFRPSS